MARWALDLENTVRARGFGKRNAVVDRHADFTLLHQAHEVVRAFGS